ncbi:SDR family NAD(P)-dependent oxidoreductase [Ferrovibrio sp.]|uniref:SDR family NAD(P)-dependent oxidoreductase n=1 Tax=Ferrovibrio sp. TaxID=1917215 RepID=UPI003D0F8CB4
MTERNLLEGKVVVVTGGAGAIGSEIAKLAAAHGAKVVVNDLGGNADGGGRDTGPADRVVAEIAAAGGAAVPSYHSITSWEGGQAIIADAIDAFGRIDAVVNNAGILRDVIFHKMSQEDWQAVESVNLAGSFYVARAAANHFKLQHSGRFVHMTSTSGLIGNLGQVNYGASKMGVAAMSKMIAMDMQRFGVTSNAIAPFAYSRLIGQIPTNTEANRKRVEVLKTMTADKIAPFTVSLLTDQAADVTGQLFAVRRNEIFLMSQPRPIRSVHASEGWTPETCLERAIPALRGSFYPLEKSSDIFTWDPV